MRPADRKPELAERLLRESAVVLEPVAIGAAADDLEAVAPERLLQLPTIVGNVFEEDDAVIPGLTHPIELLSPVRNPRDHPGKHIVTPGLGDEDAYLVTLLGQTHIHRGHVAGVADREKPHPVPEVQLLGRKQLVGAAVPADRGARDAR